jgi:1,4-dihydroxy-2-naphthoyl-CoA hydrolase
MTIWKRTYDIVQANIFNKDTIAEPLGLLFTEIGSDYVMGTMPVDKRTHQPMGILHGGASVVLAESLGSFAAHMAASDNMACVGLDINANHIRSVRSGLVTGVARPIHIGRRTQVWEIHITDEADKLVCVSRLTMAVIDTV